MVKTVGQFANECRTFSVRVQEASREGVNAGALHVTTSIRRELKRVVPDQRLSGTRKKSGERNSAKLSVGYHSASKGHENPSALISAQGPWPLVESDMPKHGEPKKAKLTKSGRVRKNFRTRKILNIPGIGFRRFVQHPGTKGQHPFRKGVNRSARDVPAVMAKEIRAEMRRVFS